MPRHLCAFVSQVALEVIEELCYEMGLHTLEAMREYAIFLVTSGGEPTDSSLHNHSHSHTLKAPVELEFEMPEKASSQNQPWSDCSCVFVWNQTEAVLSRGADSLSRSCRCEFRCSLLNTVRLV